MSSRSSGVASRASGRIASLAGLQRARRRAQLLGGRAEQGAEPLQAVHRARGRLQRARELAHGGRHVGLLGCELAHHGGRGVDQAGQVVVARGQLAVERVERADQVPQVLAPLGDLGVHPREIAVGGLEAAQDLAQVEPAAVEAAAGVADQQRQVVARVGVELGEDLVRVDVRRGRLDRHRVALAGGGRVVAARLEVDEHVLQAGLRPQQRAGVLPDHALVLGVDDHLDHGLAVLQLDVADVADADARDADGLTLARGHGLGGGELGVQDQRRRLPREAHALLVEQVEGDACGHGDEAEHGERLLRVLPDRGHRPTCAASWSMSCWSASVFATSRSWSRPSALSWSRSQSTAFVLACA